MHSIHYIYIYIYCKLSLYTLSCAQESVHFSSRGTSHNISLSALSIKDPDCHGWLYKQGHSLRTWRRRYCVLKDHQLFYYGKMSHTTAYGVMNIKDYSVVCGKSRDKKFYFNVLPPGKDLREYKFYTETEGDRERWGQRTGGGGGYIQGVEESGEIGVR